MKRKKTVVLDGEALLKILDAWFGHSGQLRRVYEITKKGFNPQQLMGLTSAEAEDIIAAWRSVNDKT